MFFVLGQGRVNLPELEHVNSLRHAIISGFCNVIIRQINFEAYELYVVASDDQ